MPSLRPFFRPLLCLTGLLPLAPVALSAGPAAAVAPRANAWVSARLTYDSNVYMTDTAAPGSAPARLDSLVSTLAAGARLEWPAGDRGTASAAYDAEHSWFHAAAGENHTVHRAKVALSRRAGRASWNLTGTGAWTDGLDLAPVYLGQGGAPALGASPVRDRRDAFVGRGALQGSVDLGRWQLRPSLSAYLHDFRLRQTRDPGYMNFIDRSELLGGFDVARRFAGDIRLVAGWRTGRQQQFRLFGVDSPFDSTINRVLLGAEGSPRPWLRFAVLAGPESRRYAPGTTAGFDRGEHPLWLDASATVTVSPRHSFTLAARRLRQPSASSVAVYDDLVWDAAWRGQFGRRLAATASVRLARGDWCPPACREDRIVTAAASLQARLAGERTAELGWCHDDGFSRVAATPARDFRRHQFFVTLKQSF